MNCVSYLKWIIAAVVFLGSQLVYSAEQRLTIPWPTDIGPLHPHQYSPNQMFAQAMVYEPLVKFQGEGKIVPWLAKSWSHSEDGRSYTFKLRDDVRFSNGESFDASAVVANFNSILNNIKIHSWLESANQIQSVEKIDEYTIRLNLRDAYYPLLHELALPRPFRFIAPSQLQGDNADKKIKEPIGTGPWVLSQYRIGEQYQFLRNKIYWGKKPAYDAVVIKVLADSNSRAIALETGEVDLIYGSLGMISPDTFERFKLQNVMTTALSDPHETVMLALNSRKGPTADRAVRLAINHAINKEFLVSVLYGTQHRAEMLFPPNVAYTNVGLKPYVFDREYAALLLDKAGWVLLPQRQIRTRNGEDLSVELVYVGTDALYKSFAEIIQSELAKIGVKVILVAEEESGFYSRQLDGRFDMIFNSTWGAPYDPHAFLSSMRVPNHADFQAQAGLVDKKEIDQLISKVLLSTDESKRQALYKDILTRLHDHAVYVPLIYRSVLLVARENVGVGGFSPVSLEIPFEEFQPKPK